jgi:hypothetical protein
MRWFKPDEIFLDYFLYDEDRYLNIYVLKRQNEVSYNVKHHGRLISVITDKDFQIWLADPDLAYMEILL